MLTKLVTAGIAAGTLLICSGGVLAKPGHCPPGHAKKGWCSPGQYQSRGQAFYNERRRGSRLEYYERRVTPRYEDRRWRY